MVVLITGANKGIGFATAKLFQDKGYKVIITGRNEKKLIAAKERLGKNTEYIIWDIADVSSAIPLIKRAHSIWGNIDVFVNNAGIVSSEDNGPKSVGFFEKTRGKLKIQILSGIFIYPRRKFNRTDVAALPVVGTPFGNKNRIAVS